MAKGEAELLLKIKQTGSASIQKVGDFLKSMGRAAVAAGASLGALAGISVQAFSEQEKAAARANSALIQNGDYTKANSKAVQDWASSLQDATGIGDEAILQNFALASSFTKNTEEAKKLTAAAIDFASGAQLNVTEATRRLGRAFQGSAADVANFAPGIRELTKEELLNGQATDIIAAKFKNFASRELNTAGGQIKNIQGRLGDFLEVIGQAAAPIIIALGGQFANFTKTLQGNKVIIGNLKTSFMTLAKAGIVVKGIFEGIGKVVGTVLAASIQTVGDLLAGDFKKALENATLAGQMLGEDTVNTFIETQEQLAELDAEIAEAEAAKREEQLVTDQEQAEQRRLIQEDFKNQVAAITEAKTNDQIMKEIAMERIIADSEKKAILDSINRTLKYSKDKIKILEARHNKEMLLQAEAEAVKREMVQETYNFEQFINSERVKATQSALGQISTLTQANSKFLVGIGKAAALAQVAINTAQGVSKAWAIGGPFGAPLAAAVAVAGAVQAARISGIKLAEGGIVSARPGGINAVVGEAGKDEAVIPLDSEDAQNRLGSNLTINIHGNILGDDTALEEFVQILDEKFLVLRQKNASVAFDEGVV